MLRHFLLIAQKRMVSIIFYRALVPQTNQTVDSKETSVTIGRLETVFLKPFVRWQAMQEMNILSKLFTRLTDLKRLLDINKISSDFQAQCP